ncbi:S-protein homolog 5-like [Lotus japonicus]|uniref:S-protein homolog 5-like n=1 Tax=Lotus japonicus TaxID=34305 RepID=UPI00258D28AE|nr:S-protein homolog 5-like [Lotus japonicus]
MLKVLVTIVSVLVIISACVLIVPVQGQEGGVDRWFWRKTVRIINDLGDDSTQLYVHCRSKDDDIGEHYLTNGQFIEWSFNVNIWRTTLFWCNFAWNSEQQSFDIYTRKDYNTCKAQCWRSIRPDGAYFYHEYGSANPYWLKKLSW